MHKTRPCTYHAHNNNITTTKITRLFSVVTNLVSAVDTVFEELDLDLLLLLLLILPLPFISPQQYCHSLQREQEATIVTIKKTSFEGNCWRRKGPEAPALSSCHDFLISNLLLFFFVLMPINDFKSASLPPFFSDFCGACTLHSSSSALDVNHSVFLAHSAFFLSQLFTQIIFSRLFAFVSHTHIYSLKMDIKPFFVYSRVS